MSNQLISFNEHQLDLIKDMFFKGATDAEFQMFVYACKRSGLDPFSKQIYPIKRWDPTLGKNIMTIQTGIDGYRLIAERTGCYSPGRESTYQYDKEGKLLSATAYIKKRTNDGMWHEVSATAFYSEYVQTFTDKKTGELRMTKFWSQMPHSQLAKCAEALALRKAFPAEMSGIYSQEEMQQADTNKSSLSEEQTLEINDILEQCDPKYQDAVHRFIRKEFGVCFINDIPAIHFERIKQAALINREEYISKKKEPMLLEEQKELVEV